MTEVNATPSRPQHETTATLAANRHGCARGAAQSLLTPPFGWLDSPFPAPAPPLMRQRFPVTADEAFSRCRRTTLAGGSPGGSTQSSGERIFKGLSCLVCMPLSRSWFEVF